MKYNYAEIFEAIPNKINDKEEVEKIVNAILGLICYLDEGDVISTPFASFEKIGSDLLIITNKRNPGFILDELDKSGVVKI